MEDVIHGGEILAGQKSKAVLAKRIKQQQHAPNNSVVVDGKAVICLFPFLKCKMLL